MAKSRNQQRGSSAQELLNTLVSELNDHPPGLRFTFDCIFCQKLLVEGRVQDTEYGAKLKVNFKKAREILDHYGYNLDFKVIKGKREEVKIARRWGDKRIKVRVSEAYDAVNADSRARLLRDIFKTYFEATLAVTSIEVFFDPRGILKKGYNGQFAGEISVMDDLEEMFASFKTSLADMTLAMSCQPEWKDSDQSSSSIPEEFTGSVDKWLEIYQKKTSDVKSGIRTAMDKKVQEIYATPPILIDATELNKADETKAINQAFTETNVVIVRYHRTGRDYQFSVLFNVAPIVPLSALWFVFMDMPGFEEMTEELLEHHNMRYRKYKGRSEDIGAEASLFSRIPSNIKIPGKFEVPTEVKNRTQLLNLVINSPEGVIKKFPENLKKELTQNLIEKFTEGMAHEIIESYSIKIKNVEKQRAGGPSHQVTEAFLEHYSYYGFFDWLSKDKDIDEWLKEYGSKIRPFDDIINEYNTDPWKKIDEYVCRHLDDYFPTRRCR